MSLVYLVKITKNKCWVACSNKDTVPPDVTESFKRMYKLPTIKKIDSDSDSENDKTFVPERYLIMNVIATAVNVSISSVIND